MTKIGVFHPLFGFGGGEAVCMNVIQALQDDYDVTLLTMSTADIEEMNTYYDTSVDPSLSRHSGNRLAPSLRRSRRLCEQITGTECGRLHVGLFSRFVDRRTDEYDLLVSTFGEYDFDCPSVQYIHLPMYRRHRFPDRLRPGISRQLYNRVCDLTAGIDGQPSGTLIANSEWTAQLTEQLYGRKPETLYPPIAVDDFDGRAWEDRENGFVSIGRLDRTKRIEDMIAIVQGLRARGYDVHLHVIGPETDAAYAQELKSQCPDEDAIVFEGRLDRETLVELVETHKFGLHAKRYEHFGMSVAELVAGGTIPFVHDSGGQREIVDRDERLVYESIPDAIAKIEWMLSRPDHQPTIRDRLPDVASRFSSETFRGRVRTVIDSALG